MEAGLIDMDYNDLFHQAPCGYLSLDRRGVISKVNHTFCSWLGYEPIDLQRNFSFQDLLSVGGKIYFETHFLPMLQLQGQVNEINFEMITKNATRLPVLVNAVKIVIENRIIGFRLTIVDISQRKQYERELLKAKKLAEENAAKLHQKNIELERFSHIVSHDLKSPIRTMGGLFDIMEQKGFVSNSEDSMKIQKMIRDNFRRMKLLVDDLMDQALAEKETDYNQVLNLNKIVESVKENLNDEIQKTSSKIITEVLPEVRGNESQLIRLFQNIIVNGIKYRNEANPLIKISYMYLNDKVQITVNDNGIGFDPKFKEKIFEYLHRLHGHDQIDGSGIGLYACKRIVESHGGNIHAESQPGQGSSFVFSLPLVSEDSKEDVIY